MSTSPTLTGRAFRWLCAAFACPRGRAHEHLSEFPDDGDVREAVIAALQAADRGRLRRRVEEFRTTGRP